MFRIFTIPATNPDFPVSYAEADSDLARMRGAPVPLMRPLLIFSGYRAPWIPAERLAKKLRRITSTPGMIRTVAYPQFGEIPRAVALALGAAKPDGDGSTEPVDVIGISMGGLIGRAAAAGARATGEARMFDDPLIPTPKFEVPTRRLRVVNLFTLASPHQGAILAEVTTPDPAAEDMLRGSGFLRALDEALPTAEYTLTCYARIRDGWVGATRTAPPGYQPIWTSGLLWGSHFSISDDPRIVADICRRLRGETPLAIRASKPPTD